MARRFAVRSFIAAVRATVGAAIGAASVAVAADVPSLGAGRHVSAIGLSIGYRTGGTTVRGWCW
jgi:hypothetical protein